MEIRNLFVPIRVIYLGLSDFSQVEDAYLSMDTATTWIMTDLELSCHIVCVDCRVQSFYPPYSKARILDLRQNLVRVEKNLIFS